MWHKNHNQREGRGFFGLEAMGFGFIVAFSNKIKAECLGVGACL
ncbi:hypothetical protein HBZC1_04510 [Helicobacter bizzozeronii CIII-1]|uniref:Uncharacterized protein n=1 Tax=Helicobacter bizzozeronii (strain CIII-1) TaxID=1002804 RepID=F8KRQ0_HELBC|nr:hypothetical protein HBZC1_04510 [Helicobacter bizzozeronii CIII-1]